MTTDNDEQPSRFIDDDPTNFEFFEDFDAAKQKLNARAEKVLKDLVERVNAEVLQALENYDKSREE
jgi:hypothetical protein